MTLMTAASGKTSSSEHGPVHSFLKAYKVNKGETYNYTYMGKPYGSYMVPEDKRDAFYKAYAETVKAGTVPSLTEKQGLAGPVVVDLDFKFPGHVKDRQYTADMVKAVVASYFAILGEYVQLDADNNECYIFERAAPYVEEKPGKPAIVKDGLHMMFPAIKCYKRLKGMARDHVMKECKTLFEKLGTTNSVDDIVDKAVISTNNWFVYLSSKPGRQPHKLTRILDNTLRDVTFRDSSKLVPLLSVAGDAENVLYIKELPPQEPSSEQTPPARQNDAAQTPLEPADKHDPVSCNLLQQSVMGLDPTRAKPYRKWLKIVFGILNVSQANKFCPEGHRLIHEFSEQSPEYDAQELNTKLATLQAQREGGIGFGTIVRKLQKDNPELYQKLFKKPSSTSEHLLQLAISRGGQHVDVAKVFSSLFPGEFKWATTKQDPIFYRFSGTIWVRQEDDAVVYKLLSCHVADAFQEKAAFYREQAEAEQDLVKKEKLEKQRVTATKVANQLLNMSYLKQVCHAISKHLHGADLLQKMDTNLDLVAFKDGVYNLMSSAFRQGRPEDLLSVCIPFNYPTTGPQQRAELLTFLSQIKPQEDELEYLLDQLSQCLSGRIRKQVVHILAGQLACNGKSTLLRLVQLAFGGYYCSMPIAYLTQKSASANAANPIILKLKPARIVGSSEPEEETRFNGSILKGLRGGDEQEGRALFSNKLVSYYPQLRLFILCNDTPYINGKDKGLKRRITKITFSSQFKESVNEPDLVNHVYPINVDMDDKLQSWAPELILLLLERFKPDYVYSCPSSIQQGTNDYMNENDPVSKFVRDKLEQDAESCVTFCELRQLWTSGGYGLIKLSDLKKELVRVLGTECIVDSHFKGEKYKNFFKGYNVRPEQCL